MTKVVEGLRVLPQNVNEYTALTDCLGVVRQILAAGNCGDFGTRVVDSLAYYQMPYLTETGVSDLQERFLVSTDEASPRQILVYKYLEVLLALQEARVDCRQLITQSARWLYDLVLFSRENEVQRRLAFTILSSAAASVKLATLGDLCVREVSQAKLRIDQLEHSGLILLALRTLVQLAQRQQLSISHASDQATDGSLSEVANAKLAQFSSYGWLVRFSETCDSRLRVLTWDLLTAVFDYEFLRTHPSIVHSAVNCLLKDQELFFVKIAALKFLNKTCQALIVNCDLDAESEGGEITIATLLQTVNRQGLISQVHKMLVRRDCPLLFLTLVLQLLHNLAEMDFERTMPLLSQLDCWSFLVDMLDVSNLRALEASESRGIIAGIRPHLNVPEPCQMLDNAYMAINRIQEFLFTAFKRDSQLAATLIKTTRILPRIFTLIQETLSAEGRPMQHKELLTVFIDKAVKLLHVALLHPKDYTVTVISDFWFAKGETRNWMLLLGMFGTIEGSKQAPADVLEIKLCLIRFTAELLLSTAHMPTNHLDESI
jgi:hypothetical protein